MARLQLPNPAPTNAAVRSVMRANRARDTGPERTVRGALRAAGYPGYRLNWKGAPGRPDVSYPGRYVAVFVHGCYWHHCPRCQPGLPRSNAEFWLRKFELNRERDERKRRDLEARGWRVHEIWECDIRERLSEVISLVCRDLDARANQHAPKATRSRARPTLRRVRRWAPRDSVDSDQGLPRHPRRLDV